MVLDYFKSIPETDNITIDFRYIAKNLIALGVN